MKKIIEWFRELRDFVDFIHYLALINKIRRYDDSRKGNIDS